MPEYRSNAEEIRFYAKQLLQDGLTHRRSEIFQYVKAHAPHAHMFTNGMLTGAIYDLVHNSNGVYINPVRGYYQKAPQQPGAEPRNNRRHSAGYVQGAESALFRVEVTEIRRMR